VELELHRNKTSRLAMLYTRDFRSFINDNFGCHVKSTSKGVERGMEIPCLQQTLVVGCSKVPKRNLVGNQQWFIEKLHNFS